MSSLDRSENLDDRLETIQEMPIPTQDRIYMALVCMDLIPAWELRLKKPSNAQIEEHNSLIISAGFETAINKRPDGLVDIDYSNSKKLAQRLKDASVEYEGCEIDSSYETAYKAELGRLYGFPPTAVEAYCYYPDNCISLWSLPEEIRNEDYHLLVGLRLSATNWQQELETPKKWAEALKTKTPKLWAKFVAEHKPENE